MDYEKKFLAAVMYLHTVQGMRLRRIRMKHVRETMETLGTKVMLFTLSEMNKSSQAKTRGQCIRTYKKLRRESDANG